MPKGYRMTIGADLGGVARVNAGFAEFAEGNALPEALRRGINVALDELLTNTITYGSGVREVSVEAELEPDRLRVTVTDDGPPFDPWAKPTPDTSGSVDQRRIGGLGIHLVKQMMDAVGYQRTADRNIVILSKRLEETS